MWRVMFANSRMTKATHAGTPTAPEVEIDPIDPYAWRAWAAERAASTAAADTVPAAVKGKPVRAAKST